MTITRSRTTATSAAAIRIMPARRRACDRYQLGSSYRRSRATDLTIDDAASTIYALANESVYLRLVDGYGWSPDRYRAWLEQTLKKTLFDAPPGLATAR
jgi:hypothetical protein